MPQHYGLLLIECTMHGEIGTLVRKVHNQQAVWFGGLVSKDPSRKIGPLLDIVRFCEDPLTALVKAIFLLLKGKLAASSGLLRNCIGLNKCLLAFGAVLR